MTRALGLALLIALTPVIASAASATFAADQSLVLATTTAANAYIAGGTVAVTAPVPADLVALGGSLLVAGSVAGDALLAGGSVDLRSPVQGDARILGGRVTVSGGVLGDLVAVAGSFTDSIGAANNAFIFGSSVSFERGAGGPVTIYANNVSLAGHFADDVTVVATGHITLAASTTIAGALNYQAPEEAAIPASATILGGIHYTGASYLPTSEEARAIALAGIGVFIFVKILGALILAGLLAGLFPSLASRLALRAYARPARSVFLTALLGFAVAVATPALLVLLAITFVGFGIAFLLGALYLTLIILALAFSGVVVGSGIARVALKRTSVRWSDAIIGMLAFYLIWSIPVLGWLVAAFLVAFTAGALVSFFYHFAFPHDEHATLEA